METIFGKHMEKPKKMEKKFNFNETTIITEDKSHHQANNIWHLCKSERETKVRTLCHEIG